MTGIRTNDIRWPYWPWAHGERPSRRAARDREDRERKRLGLPEANPNGHQSHCEINALHHSVRC